MRLKLFFTISFLLLIKLTCFSQVMNETSLNSTKVELYIWDKKSKSYKFQFRHEQVNRFFVDKNDISQYNSDNKSINEWTFVDFTDKGDFMYFTENAEFMFVVSKDYDFIIKHRFWSEKDKQYTDMIYYIID